MMKKTLTTLATFLLGSIVTFFLIQVASAHGGNANLIHGCVGTGVLNQGRLRIISANGTCQANETPLDWNKVGLPGTGSFIDNLTQSDFNGYDMRYRNLDGRNLDGSQFGSNTNLTKTSMKNVNCDGCSFGNTIFPSTDLTNANLSFANMTNANLIGAVGLGSANLTGATWDNTTCPDGTNSDNNGNTCEGHL